MNNPLYAVQLRAWADPFWASISLMVENKEGTHIGTRIEMVPIPKETMRIDPGTAQLLMDDLWRCGLRPTEGQGSAGALAATQTHLKDMQTIAFKLLDSK